MLFRSAAEMLLHIGGAANIRGAELIKTAVLEVLADGHYVGDVKKGPYQMSRDRERSGTRLTGVVRNFSRSCKKRGMTSPVMRGRATCRSR